eukprot:gene14325-15815_t
MGLEVIETYRPATGHPEPLVSQDEGGRDRPDEGLPAPFSVSAVLSAMASKPRRIGVVGYGHLGQFLVKKILDNAELELAFVWNRSTEKLKGSVPDTAIIEDLGNISERAPDLIIEVAHPMITEKYGEKFLEVADYLIGSPTALAKDDIEKRLRTKANQGKHGLYVPTGAFWAGEDIKKMADRGTLKGLKVTMKKHPSAFKLCGELIEKNNQVMNDPVILYEGPVRGLCPLAPNNVNTMAAGAIAAWNLGFDVVIGCLVSDPSLNSHIVEIDVTGPGDPPNQFSVRTSRVNPAATGVVTGTATYASFWSSTLSQLLLFMFFFLQPQVDGINKAGICYIHATVVTAARLHHRVLQTISRQYQARFLNSPRDQLLTASMNERFEGVLPESNAPRCDQTIAEDTMLFSVHDCLNALSFAQPEIADSQTRSIAPWLENCTLFINGLCESFRGSVRHVGLELGCVCSKNTFRVIYTLCSIGAFSDQSSGIFEASMQLTLCPLETSALSVIRLPWHDSQAMPCHACVAHASCMASFRYGDSQCLFHERLGGAR